MKDQIAHHEGVMPYIKTGRNELHKFEGQYFHSIHSIFDCLLPPKETFRSFCPLLCCQTGLICKSAIHVRHLWILKFFKYFLTISVFHNENHKN